MNVSVKFATPAKQRRKVKVCQYPYLLYILILKTGAVHLYAVHQHLVWHLNSAAVWVGEICLRCDGLVGPCMVGFGAAWFSCMGLLEVHV